MAAFRLVSDEVNQEAGEAIRAVRGDRPRLDVEPIPGFESMVAGAALALEWGAPNALYSSRETKADEWLREGSNEWRHLHRASALALDLARQREIESDTTSVMTHIVADVLNQTDARRMLQAVVNSDPAFETGLSESQMETVREARLDDGERESLRQQSYGNYSGLPAWRRESLSEALGTGERLGDEMRMSISIIGAIIDVDRQDLGQRNRDVDQRLADFRDFHEHPEFRQEGAKSPDPLFREVADTHFARVEALRGGADPETRAEAAVKAHLVTMSERGSPGVADEARSQALADFDGSSMTIGQMAQRIEAHRIAVEHARTQTFENIDAFGIPNQLITQTDQFAFRDPSAMDKDIQASFYSTIAAGSDVPAMDAVRLVYEGKVQEEQLHERIEAMMEQDKRSGRAPGITYEGLTQDQAKDYRVDMYMPGEMVRFDARVNIRNVDKDGMREALGTEPLEVAKAVLVATTHDNGLGGTSAAVRPEYEFVGHEGRFPAGQFVHQHGEEHVYGVVTVVDERMWLVPIDDKTIESSEGPKVSGVPREIVGTLVSDDGDRNAENLAIMKHEVGQEPVSGEFVYRPQAFGDREGPVTLVAVPWMSGAYAPEMTVSEKAIGEVLERERPLPGVMAHLAAQAAMTR